jgi:arylsulfatase A-like enzyme
MSTFTNCPGTLCPPTSLALTPRKAILLATGVGLCGGYVDLAIMLLKKQFWYDEHLLWSGRDFLWSVPLGHALLHAVPGALIAAINRVRAGLVPLRAGVWLIVSLEIWFVLLRAPIWAEAAFLLALGLGRPLSKTLTLWANSPRAVRTVLATSWGTLVMLGLATSGRYAVSELLATRRLPNAPGGARNVVLIVWDTVRADDLSPYGYARETTPHLARWARRGVLYDLAIAPAPWTFPTHSTLFTGYWPFEIGTQTTYTLRAPVPTLAEYLAGRGYQTAGFVANTNCCSYESGLDRGFAYYNDYPITLRSLLGRTLPGNWLLRNLVSRDDPYAHKWDRLQSRDARGINDDFLGWLHGRRRDRPFFAFLNYFDAHAPYLPPRGWAGRFGSRPRTPRDYQFLTGELQGSPGALRPSDVRMARDCYDACIGYLDEQLGRLMGELEREGLLENTVVVITSDHGEAFGDHGLFGHTSSVYLDQVSVPLIVLAPGAPAGRVVPYPVSLRDVPSTVVDQLGFAVAAPFPGRSLAAYWRLAPGQPSAETSPALSQVVHPAATRSRHEERPAQDAVEFSIVAEGRHYIRDGAGREQLFAVMADPAERSNRIGAGDDPDVLERLRRALRQVLGGELHATRAGEVSNNADRSSFPRHGTAPRGPVLAVGSRSPGAMPGTDLGRAAGIGYLAAARGPGGPGASGRMGHVGPRVDPSDNRRVPRGRPRGAAQRLR